MRYILHPGYVHSADGDAHWIGAKRLAELYRVAFSECVALTTAREFDHYHAFGARPGDVHLYPSNNGNYKLPALRAEETRHV